MSGIKNRIKKCGNWRGEMNDIVKRDAAGRFVDGHAGMGGRPVGTRQTFSAAFLRDLGAVWAEHGQQTMLHTAKNSPEVFFATCARLLPKDVELTIRQHYSTDIDPADLEILKAIRAALPNANELPPGEVFNFVLDAIRAANAKPIESGD
jgi:hypothetical protein